MGLPISVIIPTRNRAVILRKTLTTFLNQTSPVEEIVIIDGSDLEDTKELVDQLQRECRERLLYLRAKIKGSAAQRNQGVEKSSFPFVLFADDDVYLDKDCVDKLWKAMNGNARTGGVSSMITNQKYLPMGRISSALARFLLGTKLDSYAGKLLTPGWGMLPEDREEMPEVVEVEWCNLGATLYRKEALPRPPFQSHFKGYSMMEDITLSAFVAREWKLFNARTARIYHDSQPGDHKKSQFVLSRMEIVNRHYLMTGVMKKGGFLNWARFWVFETFGVVSNLRTARAWINLPAVLAGKIVGLVDILLR